MVIAVVLLVVAGAVLRWTHLAESYFFYFPSRGAFSTPPGWRDVRFKTADGLELHGWFAPGRGSGESVRGPAVLHAHGNAGDVSSHVGFSDFLPRAGVGVLIFDYRGYGRSEGGFRNRAALMLDTEAAFEALLRQPEVDPGRVGVYGVSLGGSFALELAARRAEVRAVATVSAFSGWSRIARDHAWWLGAALIPGGLDARDAIPRLGRRALLLVHGARDTIVGKQHGEELAARAADAGIRAELVIAPGADHNDIIEAEPEVGERIGAFFVRELGVREGAR